MNMSIFYCAILLLSLEVYGFSSSPYPDGNVNVFIKDNKPCIYIDKLNLTGGYTLIVSSTKSLTEDEFWLYKNSFEKNYPTRDNCIIADDTNFKGLIFRNNAIYNFSLEPSVVPEFADFTGMASSYCLKEKNGKLELYYSNLSIDECREQKQNIFVEHTEISKKQENWFNLLIKWFKNLWK